MKMNGIPTQARSVRIASTLMWLVVSTAAVHAGPIDPKNPPQGRFLDDWAQVYMAGGKVGYAHSTMTREGDKITTDFSMMIRMGRAGQFIEIRSTNKTQESLDGVPIGFVTEMDMSFMKTSMTGTIKDGRIKITSSQLGMQQVQEYPLPKDALLSWGLFRASLIRGFEPGLTYTLRAYAPDMRLDDAVDAVIKIKDWESFKAGDKVMRGQRVETSLVSPLGALESVSWLDKDGNTLKQQILAPGLGNMEIVTCDEAAALGDFLPPEVFMATVIQAKRRLEPRSIRQIRYRIRSKNEENKLELLPETGMQKVVRNPDGSILLEVTRQVHSKTKPDAVLIADASTDRRSTDLSEYLESNLFMNTSDPELIKLAKQAGGQESDPFVLGDKLRKFVGGYVSTKNLNVGFASASEVCRTREGDCTEHGILLAALGRLNGLPSRVVVGLAYVQSFGGQSDVFGYHMWTQFYIDGRWIDFDAALGESDCSPTRIAFATSSLKSTGLADLSLPLMKMIGAIDIDILDVESVDTTDQ